MKKLLLKYAGTLTRCEIIDRPNRFALRVRMNSSVRQVYLPNPGKLSTVIEQNRMLLCEHVPSKRRKTSFTAFAVRVDGFYITVNSAFANTIFSTAIENGALGEFKGYMIASREKRLKNGRIDFVLRDPRWMNVYVEVKSCTHVERGVAKFPDRPTERGRRHLKMLTGLAARGKKCYIIFIVQRPDAQVFGPFVEVDPEFAELLRKAVRAGVRVKAIATEFKPPNLYLKRENLPVRFPRTLATS